MGAAVRAAPLPRVLLSCTETLAPETFGSWLRLFLFSEEH